MTIPLPYARRNRRQTIGRTVGIALCAGLILWSLYLRIHRLGLDSYWYDELYAVTLASHTSADLALLRLYDPMRPPVFLMILSVWIKIFGTSESATRALSVLQNTGATLLFIPLVLSVIRPWLPRLITITLFVTLWMNIWAARQANYYSLLLLLSVLALLLWQRVAEKPTWRTISLLAVLSAIGILTHYVFFMLVLMLGAYLTVYSKRQTGIRYMVGTVVLCIPFFLLRIGVALSHIPTWQHLSTLMMLRQHFEGVPVSPIQLLSYILYQAPHVVLIGFSGLSAWAALMIVRKSSVSVRSRMHIILTLMLFFPFITGMYRGLDNWYYFYFLIPSVVLVIGILFSELRRIHAAAGIILITAIGIFNTLGLTTPEIQWEYKNIAHSAALYQSSDVVINDCGKTWIYEYYLARSSYPLTVLCDPTYTNPESRVRTYIGRSYDSRFWETADAAAASDGIRMYAIELFTEESDHTMLLKVYR